jgi:hypothetical protein
VVQNDPYKLSVFCESFVVNTFVECEQGILAAGAPLGASASVCWADFTITGTSIHIYNATSIACIKAIKRAACKDARHNVKLLVRTPACAASRYTCRLTARVSNAKHWIISETPGFFQACLRCRTTAEINVPTCTSRSCACTRHRNVAKRTVQPQTGEIQPLINRY